MFQFLVMRSVRLRKGIPGSAPFTIGETYFAVNCCM
jgi:hypothetical protein